MFDFDLRPIFALAKIGVAAIIAVIIATIIGIPAMIWWGYTHVSFH